MKLPSSTIAAQLRREAAQDRRDALREHRLEIGTPAPRKPLSVAQHDRERGRIFRALQSTCCTLATIQGQTAEQVAAAVASRVIHSLRSKRTPEAARREVEP